MLLAAPPTPTLSWRRFRGCHARRAVQAMAAAAPSRTDLLVVGPGVLGSMVADQWLRASPGARVVGQTNTETAHERLRALGVVPRTAAQADGTTFAHVLFCAPPSGSADYAAEVAKAAALWDATAGGNFVFTSSSAVYPESDGLPCDERTPTHALGAAPRADPLLRAEAAALAAGGCVLRLGGLYTRGRGAHTYFMKVPEAPGRGDGFVNLLHYTDAAAAAVAALTRGARGGVYLACDGNPVSRVGMMEAALASGVWADGRMPRFTGDAAQPRGRRLVCDTTREALGWAPRWGSFGEFVAAGAPE